MSNFLPSKRLIVFFILPLVATTIIVFIFLKNKNNSVTTKNTQDSIVAITSNNTEKQKDSDNDGLKDWQEALYKTNSNNPDTDGDGTNDGEEIKQNRNPLVTGTDDKIQKSFLEENLYSGSYEGAGLNETDKLARRFFSSYMVLKKDNKLNTETQENLINSLVNQSIQEITIKKYEIEDLKISPNQNLDTIKKYHEELNESLSKMLQIKEYEMYVLAKAIENKDQSEYQKLDLSIKIYKEVVSDLLSMEVPKDVSYDHLEMTNDLNALAECIKGATLIENDPMAAIKSIGELESAEEKLKISAQKVALYLSKNITN